MSHPKATAIALAILFFFTACQREDLPGTAPQPYPASPVANEVENQTVADPTPTILPESGQVSPVLISEVLPGVPGRNNHEFIELYNPRAEAVDLNGWELWYLTRDGQDEKLIFHWDERADIPALGHYLLVHEGEDLGILPDASYEAVLFEGKGGLVLRDEAGTDVDRFGWGEAPGGFYHGAALTEFERGDSLERLPGGELGNGVNSLNNAHDFAAQSSPNPQNSGSDLAPLPANRLSIDLTYPEAVAPGEEFELLVTVENLSDNVVSDILISLPSADKFDVVSTPDDAVSVDGRVSWMIPPLDKGESHSSSLVLAAPYANVDALISGFYAESAELPRAYGVPQIWEMDGSAIPIALARSLPEGSLVTIEGVVTMYPGGFFAGSSSAKFYVEDETGGVQVFADGGRFDVDVNLGDIVRVSGRTELFRDSLEVIPQDNVADIEKLDNDGSPLEPTVITIADIADDPAVLGRLNAIEGTAERIDELTYHYEVDLVDEAGSRALLHIEKDTGFDADVLEIGRRYRATGISELVSGAYQHKPRLQSDVVELFPPELMLEVSAPANITPGETLTLAITAVNHTPDPMTNVIVTTVLPDGSSQKWLIYELNGGGGSMTVNVDVRAAADASGLVEIGPVSAVSDQWPEPALGQVNEIYVGEGVPIWAIQGESSRSPLIGERVTTIGAVSGVFPQMDGFFIQSLEVDGDPLTSDGVFVSTPSFNAQVREGQLVRVSGRVREDSGQTILRPAALADIEVRDAAGEYEIDPVSYDPPAEYESAVLYNESLEGMLVTIDQAAVVVGPTNRYGETILVADKWDKELVRRSEGPLGYLMWIDDGTFNSHDDQTTLPVAAARGDHVQSVVGPLAYTFGNYKIAPNEQPQIQYRDHPLPLLEEPTIDQFSAATFNVENLFDAEIPHPDDPPRPSAEAYQRDLQKTAAAIAAMGAPTIVALQEIENAAVLDDLAAQAQLAAYAYTPVLLESKDSRGIGQGYLVRSDRATVEDYLVQDATGDLFSRPPLVLRATVHLESGDRAIIVLNNHFLSLSAGELQTEPVRNNQAAWNAELVQAILADNPDAHVIVLGDLNSFYDTKPIATLQDAGLRHVYELFGSDNELPYTYIFEGAAQSIDHILVSETLFDKLSRVEALHINADYPIADPDDISPRRVSDHDPLLAIFSFGE